VLPGAPVPDGLTIRRNRPGLRGSGQIIPVTNAIESINARLRKIIKTRGHFASDDAAAKLIRLALRNITADWGRAAKEWREAMNQFAIANGNRFIRSAAL
jgi:putative transposase